MSLNLTRTRQLLQDFEFGRLFVEELGWSPPANRHPVAAKAGDVAYTRAAIAELAGIGVFSITTQSGSIPDAKARIAIQKQVAENCYENLLIFTDTARTQSLWYWVKRESGKTHPRDHLYVKGQPGDLFISKLAATRPIRTRRTARLCWDNRTSGNCWLSCIRNGVIISALSAPGARAGVNERVMKKATDKAAEPEMRGEYDFSRGVRGKHARRYSQGANVVVLEADVAKVFPTSEAVNDSLRVLAGIIRRQRKALAAK